MKGFLKPSLEWWRRNFSFVIFFPETPYIPYHTHLILAKKSSQKTCPHQLNLKNQMQFDLTGFKSKIIQDGIIIAAAFIKNIAVIKKLFPKSTWHW